MSVPRITVLMPVYNGERYLQQALESILSQTFSDFEFLIINDGSTDKSVEIIQSYRDPRIRLLHNEVNLGLVATLNRGVETAKTEYIARMDCDDICLPQRLARQVEFMDHHRDVVLCGTAIKFFGLKGGKKFYPLADAEIKAHMLFESPFAHPSVMFRSGLFLKEKLSYSETAKHAEDYDLWSRIPGKYRLANLRDVLVKYRVHGNQVSREQRQLQMDEADKIRRLLLTKAGIEFSETEYDIFSKVACRLENSTEEFLLCAEALLLKILKINNVSNFYEKSAFSRAIGNFWWEVCFHSSVLGLNVFVIYLRSRLSSYSDISLKFMAIFALRCSLRFSK